MHLTLATLLCLGVALTSGAVLHRGQDKPQQHCALILPLNDDDAYEISARGGYFGPIEVFRPDLEQQTLTRVRRQSNGEATGGVDHNSETGTTVHGKVTQNVFTSKDGKHTVDANVHAQRSFNIPKVGTGPLTYGAGATYKHENLGGADVNVERTPMGTQLDVRGTRTLWQSNDGNRRLDAYGTYNRNFGGPYGTGQPNYGVGAAYTWRFG